MKVLILTGGQIEQDFLKNYVQARTFDYILAVDGGLVSADKIGLKVHSLVGDFDTVSKKLVEQYSDRGTEVLSFPADKDYTDTHLAVEKAIEMGASEITIVGGIGTRMDHTLSNIHLLRRCLEAHVPTYIINRHNRIQLINKSLKLYKAFGNYVSLLPLTTKVKGVTLKGFKYPLNNRTLHIGESVGVSNEQIEEEASIIVKEGLLLVIQSLD